MKSMEVRNEMHEEHFKQKGMGPSEMVLMYDKSLLRLTKFVAMGGALRVFV